MFQKAMMEAGVTDNEKCLFVDDSYGMFSVCWEETELTGSECDWSEGVWMEGSLSFIVSRRYSTSPCGRGATIARFTGVTRDLSSCISERTKGESYHVEGHSRGRSLEED
jgi:hypothetical protein